MVFFAAAIALALPLQTGTIEEVSVIKSFAGKLGSRISTRLSVRTEEGVRSIRIRDCRHSKFHHGPTPLQVGARIAFPDRTEVAVGDIRIVSR